MKYEAIINKQPFNTIDPVRSITITQRVREMVEALGFYKNADDYGERLEKGCRCMRCFESGPIDKDEGNTARTALHNSAQLIADIDKMEAHFREVTKKEEIKAPEVEMTEEEVAEYIADQCDRRELMSVARVVRR